MMTVAYVLIASIAGGVLSLIGGVFLLRRPMASATLHRLTAFAAGTLLATAFLELIPEAIERGAGPRLPWTLGGILLYFFLERSFHSFHRHRDHTGSHPHGAEATVPLIILSDTLHNLIDGMIIGATFLISVPFGIVTSVAVAAHEIPQEIGDFGVLLQRGMNRTRVLAVNLASALATVIAALATFSLKGVVTLPLASFLALTAGLFIYIACSDLIPEIHRHEPRTRAWAEPLSLLAGVGVIVAVDFLTATLGP